MWIGQNTELFLNKKFIEHKINTLTSEWILVGYAWKTPDIEKFLHKQKIKIFSTNAKDMIALSLKKIRTQNIK